MNRVGWALLALLATTAASPKRPLPVPPIPPAHPPSEQSAPTPDRDMYAPAVQSAPRTSVTLRDFRVRPFKDGLGYAPGSQFESGEDKRPIQTPGFMVHVPLQ